MTIVEKIKDRIAKPIYQHKTPEGVEADWCLPTMVMGPQKEARDNRRLMELALEACRVAAREVDFSDIAARPGCKRWLTVWPGEHYKLLAGLVKVLRPKVAIEIGTAEGLSALAMKKYMPEGGRVVTFDIVPWDQISDTILKKEDFGGENSEFRIQNPEEHPTPGVEGTRIEQRLGNLAEREVFEKHREVFEAVEFLFIDGPKDNNFEWRLLEYLKTVNFRKPPILVFDDTRLWSMLKFWRELPYPKLDLTSFGHSSGTGLVQWERD
jgi:predicted O-methyltransferase YrrM